MEYRNVKKRYVVLFTGVAVILGAVMFFSHNVGKRKLKAIERGDYSYINSEIPREVLERRNRRNPNDFTWIYKDINGDGEEDLIIQDDYALGSILGIFTQEGNEVSVRYWDSNDMGCYSQLCDNGLLYYDQYYGTYAYELYISYRYDKEWNEIFVDGLELYYIDDPEEGVWFKGSRTLDMKETGLYFWEFQICEGEKVYTKLTQEEWIEKFYDLFGKDCEGLIFEYYL